MKKEIEEDKNWSETVDQIVSLCIGKVVDWGQQHGPNPSTGMSWTLQAVIEELQKNIQGFHADAEKEGEKVEPYD